MQDSMYSMIRRCYENFYDFFKEFVPVTIEVGKCNDVKNTYADGNVIDHKAKDEYWTPKKGDHQPLFTVNVAKSAKEDIFIYTNSPEYFKQTLLL